MSEMLKKHKGPTLGDHYHPHFGPGKDEISDSDGNVQKRSSKDQDVSKVSQQQQQATQNLQNVMDSLPTDAERQARKEQNGEMSNAYLGWRNADDQLNQAKRPAAVEAARKRADVEADKFSAVLQKWLENGTLVSTSKTARGDDPTRMSFGLTDHKERLENKDSRTEAEDRLLGKLQEVEDNLFEGTPKAPGTVTELNATPAPSSQDLRNYTEDIRNGAAWGKLGEDVLFSLQEMTVKDVQLGNRSDRWQDIEMLEDAATRRFNELGSRDRTSAEEKEVSLLGYIMDAITQLEETQVLEDSDQEPLLGPSPINDDGSFGVPGADNYMSREEADRNALRNGPVPGAGPQQINDWIEDYFPEASQEALKEAEDNWVAQDYVTQEDVDTARAMRDGEVVGGSPDAVSQALKDIEQGDNVADLIPTIEEDETLSDLQSMANELDEPILGPDGEVVEPEGVPPHLQLADAATFDNEGALEVQAAAANLENSKRGFLEPGSGARSLLIEDGAPGYAEDYVSAMDQIELGAINAQQLAVARDPEGIEALLSEISDALDELERVADDAEADGLTEAAEAVRRDHGNLEQYYQDLQEAVENNKIGGKSKDDLLLKLLRLALDVKVEDK